MTTSYSVIEAVESHKGLLTARDLAEILNVTPKTVYKGAAAKQIPSFRVCGALRFEPRSLSFWLRKKDSTLAAAERASRPKT